jgi:hypothetical protein
MHRKTDLILLAVKPGWSRGPEREWTATFRLTWGEERHMLAVVVTAANGAEAEAAARRAVAAQLKSLMEQVVRAGAEARRPAAARGTAAAVAPAAAVRPGMDAWIG